MHSWNCVLTCCRLQITNIELRFHKTLESHYKSVIIPIYENQNPKIGKQINDNRLLSVFRNEKNIFFFQSGSSYGTMRALFSVTKTVYVFELRTRFNAIHKTDLIASILFHRLRMNAYINNNVCKHFRYHWKDFKRNERPSRMETFICMKRYNKHMIGQFMQIYDNNDNIK